jgi:biuret amidohydrolase
MSWALADTCLIVVIDMHEGHIGPSATIPAPDAPVQAMLLKMKKLLEGARRFAIPIVHVRYEAEDGIHNAHPAWDTRWAKKHCVRGSETTEFVVKPEHPDYVINTKRTYNCFAYTDLELYMKRLGRDTIVITGIATDCCCLATAFAASDLHYKVIAISDCQVGMSVESHDAALGIVQAMLGQVMEAGEFLAASAGIENVAAGAA